VISLVIDTETTGLPLKGVPASAPTQARVMQLAALLMDGPKRIGALYTLLFPNWPGVHPMALAAHGITTSRCNAVGVGQKQTLALLDEMVDAADVVVAHNYKFDYQMLTIEYELQGRLFTPRAHACTMEILTPICGLKRANGAAKWPNLAEALKHCGFAASNTHDAWDDAVCCAALWQWIQDNNVCKTINNA